MMFVFWFAEKTRINPEKIVMMVKLEMMMMMMMIITMLIITMMIITMMMIGMLSKEVHIKDSQETGQWPTTTLTLPKRGIFRAAVGGG